MCVLCLCVCVFSKAKSDRTLSVVALGSHTLPSRQKITSCPQERTGKGALAREKGKLESEFSGLYVLISDTLPTKVLAAGEKMQRWWFLSSRPAGALTTPLRRGNSSTLFKTSAPRGRHILGVRECTCENKRWQRQPREGSVLSVVSVETLAQRCYGAKGLGSGPKSPCSCVKTHQPDSLPGSSDWSRLTPIVTSGILGKCL